jgi:hypothetical protein
MLPRVNPVCSSSALHEFVCVCGTALLPPSSSCARCWPRWAAAVGAAEFEGARTIGRRRFALLLTAALVNTVCVGTAWRHRCSDASCRALALGQALIYQPSLAASVSLRSCSRPMPTRHMRRLHAARRVGAGKHDFQRDDRSGLLRWARESTALAMSGGRKKRRRPRQQRRTSSTVIISEARLSRACVGAAPLACSTS